MSYWFEILISHMVACTNCNHVVSYLVKRYASALYANAYEPKATPGEGLDIFIILSGVDDAELDGRIWETGLLVVWAVSARDLPRG